VQSLFAGRLFRNRGGAIAAAVAAALLATILLIVYLHSYRSSVNSGKRPERVLVAKALIPQGTSGSLIAKQGLYQVTTVQKDQLKALALSDPAALTGSIAAHDIFPGQQMTQADFAPQAETSIPYQITGAQRAIAIPVDSAHGLIGQVTNGNFVDVYVGVSGAGGSASAGSGGAVVTLLLADVLVLSAPGAAGPNAILRVTSSQAARFAFAADNARIWLVLRPQVGAKRTLPTTATLATLLAGGKK
jgi:Flp pilus assembly protein CpaB